MKKLAAIALMLIMVFSITLKTHSNPYGLFRGGNCVYFTYECIDAYWEMTPDIPRDWDAYNWAELIGQEKDGYIIEQVTVPSIGDIFVFPVTSDYPKGHVGMIVGLNYELSLPERTYEVYYKAIESGMYPDKEEFKYKYKGCAYRYHNYWHKDFESAVILRCVKK